MVRILVIHGPNLQLIGNRQPDLYGRTALRTINDDLRRAAGQRAVLTIAQSNHEGQIVELIGNAKGRYDAILINPAAYTHTSVAIRDALEAAAIPAVEVHLSNIYSREAFRRESLIAPVCRGQIAGFGPASYQLGLEAAIGLATSAEPPAARRRRPPRPPTRRRKG